jgi:hypothetical protein
VRFSHSLRYEATPAEVRAMLSDPSFREKVCEAVHATRIDVTVDSGASGPTVVVDQTQPARGIPSFARRFVGDEIQIVQRESWRDDTAARLTVNLPGKPGRFDGELHLQPDGTGTTETVTGNVEVKVPLVGGRLEGLVSDLLKAALNAEQRVGRAWLTTSR